MMILLRIVEKLFIIYFTLYVIIDIFLYVLSIGAFRKRKLKHKGNELSPVKAPFVSIIVPAYNEEVSLALCVKMLLNLEYSNYEVIVVNDGSTDSTIQSMLDSFVFKELTLSDDLQSNITTSHVRKMYVVESGKLSFIDKENGGKADAINAAINIARGEFICTIDADSILDKYALQHVIRPLTDDDSVFVSGGQIALSNDLIIENNCVVSARIPGKLIVLWQILEYISTFMIARISLSRLNVLLIMSGAFSIFRKKDLLDVGGFLTMKNDHPYIIRSFGGRKQVLTEDMEIVLRLWKFFKEKKMRAKAVFMPGPVCWTEAPEKFRQLFRQRARWHQGLAETIFLYRGMIFEPKYGTIGMIALPYIFFLELLAPIMKLIAIPVFIMLYIRTDISQQWILFFVIGTILLYTIIMSTLTVIIEKWSIRQMASTNRDALRYKTVSDWILLLIAGITANFSFAFYRMFAQIKGFINFFRKKQNWMKFERKGVKQII